MAETIYAKVRASVTGQKTVTIPKDSKIQADDNVRITLVIDE